MALPTTFLDLDFYVNQHPGLESVGRATDRLRVAPQEGFLGFMPLTYMGLARDCVALGCQYYGHGWDAADETQTLNSGTIAASANGLLFTTAASSAEVVTRGLRTYTPAAGQYWKAVTRLQSTTAATCGLFFGIAAADTTPIASDPTDMVALRCPNNSAALTARVIGNGGTAADQTTFVTDAAGTMAAVSLANTTDMELGVEFYIGSTAALSWGAFWVNGFRTAFTAAQITQLFAMLTTPQAMTRYLAIQGDGSARTATVQYVMAQVTR